jgi:uncharacterized protein YbaR (Trm112 family)
VHLLLTDRLTCPRCGPGFGLILLAHSLEDRVVHEGVLGCANCRDSFPIVRGLADLRAPPRDAIGAGLAGEPTDTDSHGVEGARLIAQLGILGGPGSVGLVGGPARAAAEVARALPEIQVVAMDPDLVHWPETERVSRLVTAPGIPLVDRATRGVAIDGRLAPTWIAEAVRVVAPRGRVVVVHAGDDVVGVLDRSGAKVVASDAETVVAARS